MATYKVIQDIEAEDKFVFGMTLRQFVFGMIGLFFGWLNVFAFTQNFPFAIIIFLPPMLLGFFLAFPWSKEQPTETWVLAKLRFKFKSRVRIWDQSGIEELVTITVPKVEEKFLTNNLSQTEVRSRLKALADTIDSRGWAVKHADLGAAMQINMTSDRLINPLAMPGEVPTIDLNTVLDVMDGNAPTASNLDRMIQENSARHRQENLDKMNRVRNGEAVNTPVQPVLNFIPPRAPTPGFEITTDDEAALSAELKAHKMPDVPRSHHMRIVEPINPYAPEADTAKTNAPENKPQAAMPTDVDPGIIEKYKNDTNLSISTISREAKKDSGLDDGEVVISLH